MSAALIWFFWQTISYFPPIQARLELYINSIALWLEYPVFGTGLGGFDYHYAEFQQVHLMGFFDQLSVFPEFRTLFSSPYDVTVAAHNEFLQILVETGVVGFCLVLSFVFLVFQNLNANSERSGACRAGIIAALIFATIAMMNFPLRNPATAGIGAIILGLLARRSSVESAADTFSFNVPNSAKYFPVLLAGLVMVFAMGASGNMLLASRDYTISHLTKERFPGRSFFHIRRAYDKAPNSVMYRRNLFGSYVEWAIRNPKRFSISDTVHKSFYEVGLSAGAQNPGVLLSRIKLLFALGLNAARRAEIEILLKILKRNVPYLHEVNYAEGV